MHTTWQRFNSNIADDDDGTWASTELHQHRQRQLSTGLDSLGACGATLHSPPDEVDDDDDDDDDAGYGHDGDEHV